MLNEFQVRVLSEAQDAKFDKGMKNLIKYIEKLWLDSAKRMGYNTDNKPEYSYTMGKKYARLVVEPYPGQKSVWCFVNVENGDVLKAAGWKGPAKGVRGNIYDKKSWKGFSEYGPQYNK